MDIQELARIVSKVEKENEFFSKKAHLDPLSLPAKIVGRQRQAEELVRYLAGYKQGFVVPFISVYGRSGSGKSTITKFVCKNLPEITYCFVNLRKAKTIFGCVNLILAELDEPSLKSAQGINLALEKIEAAIKQRLQKEKKRIFVIVLDEFDVLFFDKRSKPSDFIYKLIVLEENLRQKGFLLCVIGISNNVISDYEIDDRVRSRIGSSEIFFEPYSWEDVLKILHERAKETFSKKVDDQVLQYCAQMSHLEHGDARRAIDLLRVAAEIASKKGETISKQDVDKASQELQKDRVEKVLAASSYHFKLACASLAKLTFLSNQDWHATSSLYKQYCSLVQKGQKPLTSRRVSELLTELVNTGLATSQTLSKGRHGYGTQYRLTVPPEIVGKTCFPDWWKSLVKRKEESDKNMEEMQRVPLSRSDPLYQIRKDIENTIQKEWKD